MIRYLCALTLSLIALAPLSFADENDPDIRADLLVENRAAAPGSTIYLGLFLEMKDPWHTYWINPGQSGFPTDIEWELPDGVSAGPIQWPVPKLFDALGLVGYGYEEEVLHLVPITLSDSLKPGSTITLKASTSWLGCADLCIPGFADFEVTINIESAPSFDPEVKALFDKYRARLPKQAPSGWQAQLVQGKTFSGVLIQSPNPDADLNNLYFFSISEDAELALTQNIAETSIGKVLLLPMFKDGQNVDGLLHKKGGFDNGAFAFKLSGPVQNYPDATLISMEPSSKSFLYYVAFAFFGGLILNLMPCVFPVIGLKIMGFMSHASEAPWKARAHGLIFSAGVVLSFLALASVLLILKAGGAQLGWGFQLQSPLFIAFLCLLLVVVSLNFLSVFEFGGSLIGKVAKLDQGNGFTGTFLSGVLAVALATPCTAPFMGAALAFALGQPAIASLAVFASLGLGMASPYLLLTLFPALMRQMPKPGPWMETMKEVLAFPLLATVVWLLWVFDLQTSADSMARLLFALLLVSLALWMYGKFILAKSSGFVTKALALLFAVFGLYLAYDAANVAESDHAAAKATEWAPYSKTLVQSLEQENQPYFIDFTAAWCITCQANKKTVLHKENILKAFRDKNITLIEGDWTKNDPLITQALESYNRSGVPTYVFYDGINEPELLPELLTQTIVKNAINRVP